MASKKKKKKGGGRKKETQDQSQKPKNHLTYLPLNLYIQVH